MVRWRSASSPGRSSPLATPIAVDALRPDSRKRRARPGAPDPRRLGRLYKVLPTALVAARCGRRSRGGPRGAGRRRLDHAAGAPAPTCSLRDARQVVEVGVARARARDVIHPEGGSVRVRDRNVLRYYARIDSTPAAAITLT